METWLAYTLAEVRKAIKAAEQRERERQRGIRDRPAPPDWLLELGLNRDSRPVQVHAGGCWNAGKRGRGISREEARRALVSSRAASRSVMSAGVTMIITGKPPAMCSMVMCGQSCK
ncbi:DUF6233 domain-containing protein [Streptomyces flaveolus]|uniref:DUF6233 domain-containing protein n=1 Tax=Streptomyces flaveolus TaxID=67297 RepID=A0ABV1VBN5_9ACTN